MIGEVILIGFLVLAAIVTSARALREE